MDGTWKPGFYYGSIKDGFTALAPYGPGVTAKTKAAIAAKKALLVSGKWNEFCGPVSDQSGAVKIPKGTCLDPKTKAGIDALYSMQWLVKGVLGSVSHVPPPG
jgi:basic membrane lipoprotein Med (substrate-binding protein (PBP1-ABC) superfamily)